MQTALIKDADMNDFFAAATVLAERGFTLFCHHARRNARRISRLVLALAPLMVLMVGSCKTPQSAYMADGAYVKVSARQLQKDLFPGTSGGADRPAAGYIAEARDFVDNSPRALLMLTRADIGYIFGQPSFRRHDANAEVWQYKTRSCVIDFYFYGKKPASYVDARLKDQSPVSGTRETQCLHDINADDDASEQI
ncbi:MAG: hypothetical protein KGL10_01310 [Alphaproteobacteria bacterium]|nr:hypothetical protein [Alphaproteobacteria bacterium]MDE2335926.1 hypothetical protein [Alphaproteobacteria bacterium]